MSITSYGLLLLLLIVMNVVGLVGEYAGYTVGGVEQGVMSASNPGVIGVVEWAWESISFMFYMATFQVDDMPVVISGAFLIMSLMAVFLIVRMVRGVS